MLGRTAATDPDAHVRFAEMLPSPDDCWLEHEDVSLASRIGGRDRLREVAAVEVRSRRRSSTFSFRGAVRSAADARAGE